MTFEQAGFERATRNRDFRQIWMASGEVGSGKTRFALTGPQPIIVQSMDKGLEGVVEPILNDMPDKAIYFREYDWIPDETEAATQELAIEIREQILKDFNYALKHARTILWDKETDVREVVAYAANGGPTGGSVKDWAKLNQWYFNLINKVKGVKGVNFGLIQSMRDEWIVGDKANSQGEKKKSFSKTGRRIRAGFDRLDELVMTEMHFRREQGEFYIDIGKCRQNGKLQDKTYPGMTFSEFGTLLIPNSAESDWQ